MHDYSLYMKIMIILSVQRERSFKYLMRVETAVRYQLSLHYRLITHWMTKNVLQIYISLSLPLSFSHTFRKKKQKKHRLKWINTKHSANNRDDLAVFFYCFHFFSSLSSSGDFFFVGKHSYFSLSLSLSLFSHSLSLISHSLSLFSLSN